MRFSRVSRLGVLAALAACSSSAPQPPAASPDETADAGKIDLPPRQVDAGATADDAAGAKADANEGALGSPDGASPLPSLPADTWTWVPEAASRCGNGSTTGIGVSPHAGATSLLLYLQGGGACEDAETCWGASPAASNMTGYGASDFAADPTVDAVIFQRANAGNPFRDTTMVFVPYCTGDLHVGTATTTYTVNGVATPTYFHGADNLAAFNATLAASYPALSHVFLTGVSAGGFGTFLNQDAVVHAFGGIRVDVIDDSGPALSGSTLPADWSARFPAACTTCVDGLSVFQYMRTTYPTSRFGFLTFQTDTTLPAYFGETDAAFAQLIAQFVSSLSADPNTAAFVDTSSGHVVLAESDSVAAPYILPWLTQMATDDPAWTTVEH